MSNAIDRIVAVFEQRGSLKYGSEAVTQLQHALQCATLAMDAGGDDALVAAALLHDVGHILESTSLPSSDRQDLNDRHEALGYAFLMEHFGSRVADPVLLHVSAKRYLCTKHPEYEASLSPTSRRSYHDQGGRMSEKEVTLFESEPYFLEALRLRKWDDTAKDAEATTPELQTFLPCLKRCLAS